MNEMKLAIVQTHPIQYYAPIYAALQRRFGVETCGIYGSDFSVNGYRDREFGNAIKWAADLTSGYEQVYLSHDPLEKITSRGFLNAIDRVRPSALLITGYRPIRFYLFPFIAAKIRRIPVLFKAETTDVAVGRSFWSREIRAICLRALYKQVRYFLYIGHNSKQHYMNHGISESRLIFSPMSVPSRPGKIDAASSRLRIRRELGIPDDIYAGLFSGKFTRKKSPDHLILAARKLPPRLRSRLALIFVGNGELMSEMKKMAADQLPSDLHSVHFVGFKNQDEIDDYYRAGDFLVLSSLFEETWGLVVNEAMMQGKPCIVSNRVGCAEDLIIDALTGFRYRAGDIDELADRIMKMFGLVRRSDVEEACRSQVARYSTEAAAGGIADACRRLKAGA